MSLDKLAALRAQFKDPVREGPREGGGVNKYYPFWDMKNDQRAIIRFLPDLNKHNERGFLVEKTSHNLTINGQKKTVPCLTMYGEECPVCKVSQNYYKIEDKINGKKYWRKKQYVAQALVIEDPLPPNTETGEKHQGQVKYIALGYQLYNIIKEAFASEDDPLEADPSNLGEGYDFIIKKTQQGEYSTYTMGTKFHSKQRGLTEMELAIASDGMVELETLLPKNPGVEKVQAMLDADLNGSSYEEGQNSSSHTPPPSSPQPSTVAKQTAQVPVEETKGTAAPASNSSVDEMLAAIKARRAAASAAK
jgi:gp32 DNA binding protein like